jgi:outer membrane PBP1 activator LpoA protein
MMSLKYVKVLLMASLLGGLCACAQVNTTAGTATKNPSPFAAPATAGMPSPSAQSVQKDIPAPAEPVKIPAPSVIAVPLHGQKPMPMRIALLLPLRSDALGQVATVVRAGFMAAYEREKEQGLSITVIETSEAVQDVLSAYNAAALNHDIVVGPLTRTGVTAIVQGGAVSKPTIALGQPDTPGGVEIMLPQKMLAIGLSIEDEARQVANWARADKPAGKVFSVSTGIAWQRRAASAFAAEWQRLGAQIETMELRIDGGFLGASGLLQLRKRIETEKPEFLFIALDASQARQLREAIGTDTAMVGTSQLNPYTLPDWATVERMPDMNGVQLIDIPWQLQPYHPAVAAYPRLATSLDQRRSADHERLYALGIDAYRVAREIALNRSQFELDGVTGKLKVDLYRSTARFERTEVPAIYQDGIVVPLPGL